MQVQVGVYKTLEKIGEGGMGEVYRGLDTMLEREVAIKQLRAELAGHTDVVERFRTEAVTLGKLNHPNVVTLYSFLREDNALYMVLEFVRGETLDAVIRRRGALPWPEAVGFVLQALRGLEHAHQMQVIHRDLKPANVILATTGVLKLMDFGIARILNTARMTRVGHMIGTLQYMAPEQIKGAEGDARSDLYSLGIVLYELLAGRVPFDGTTDYELIRAQVEAPVPPLETFGVVAPPVLARAVARALAKSPEARFQSAGEFRQALQTVLDQAGTPLLTERTKTGAGVAEHGSARPEASVPGLATARMREGFLALIRGPRALARAAWIWAKTNPIITAAAIMVLVGLAFVVAARSGRDVSGASNTKVDTEGVSTKAGSKPDVRGSSPRPAVTTDAPRFNTPEGTTSTPEGEGPSPAPVRRSAARPPTGKATSPPTEQPAATVAPPPNDRPAPAIERPVVPAIERPVAPQPSEASAPQVIERPAPPSPPASPLHPRPEQGGWNTPVRR